MIKRTKKGYEIRYRSPKRFGLKELRLPIKPVRADEMTLQGYNKLLFDRLLPVLIAGNWPTQAELKAISAGSQTPGTFMAALTRVLEPLTYPGARA